MTTINLKDYYPWYLTNEYIEVTDEVAEALMASKRAEAAHAERVRYNRAYYSLDCDDGIEYSYKRRFFIKSKINAPFYGLLHTNDFPNIEWSCKRKD